MALYYSILRWNTALQSLSTPWHAAPSLLPISVALAHHPAVRPTPGKVWLHRQPVLITIRRYDHSTVTHTMPSTKGAAQWLRRYGFEPVPTSAGLRWYGDRALAHSWYSATIGPVVDGQQLTTR